MRSSCDHAPIQTDLHPFESVFTSDGSHILTCTLLGKLAKHKVLYDAEKLEIKTIWRGEAKSLQKVSAIALSDSWLAVGGFGQDEKGIVELWSPSSDSASDLTTQVEGLSVSHREA